MKKEKEVALIDAYQHYGYRESDTSGTLTAGQNGGVRGDTPFITEKGGGEVGNYIVRRLTPL